MNEQEECTNGHENAYCEHVDENGTHYVCPDCGYEWTDTSTKAERKDNEDVE